MTKKRFTYEYDEYNGNLFDNKMNTFYHIEDSDENIKLLCDRLNLLVEENVQLKNMVRHSYVEHKRCVNNYVDKIKEVEKENEQLKSKNRGLQSELQIFKEDVTHSNLQINKLADENEQLKQQINNDFKLHYTENYREFNKDELFVKDTNTEIELKDGNMIITVFVPQINQYSKFNYYVTGKRGLMRVIE